MSGYWSGKTLSPEHRAAISSGLRARGSAGLPIGCPKGFKRERGNYPIGKPKSEASKQKCRETHALRKAAGLPIGRPRGPLPHTPEWERKRIAASRRGIRAAVEAGTWGRWRIGQKHSDEAKRKIAAKSARPEMVRRTAAAMSKHPNRLERRVLAALVDAFPSMGWVFNPGVVINGKIPDFVRSDGVPIAVDVFGDYWHREDTPSICRKRQRLFASVGWRLVIIWEGEFARGEKVLRKRIVRAECAIRERGRS